MKNKKIQIDRVKSKPIHTISGNRVMGFNRVSTDLNGIANSNKFRVYKLYPTRVIGF